MDKLEFNRGVKERFKTTRKRFDKKADSTECEVVVTRNAPVKELLKFFKLELNTDFKTNITKKDKRFTVSRNFSVACGNKKLSFLMVALRSYDRYGSGGIERFDYMELYSEGCVFSYMGTREAILQAIKEHEHLDPEQVKTVKDVIGYCSSHINRLKLYERVFTYRWLDNVIGSQQAEINSDDVYYLTEHPVSSLLHYILGYSALAYVRIENKINEKIMLLNIVTDKESLKVVAKLIKSCFMYTGERDIDGIAELLLSKETQRHLNRYVGRCVIINAFKSKTADIEQMLNKYYAYIRECERPVDFPYQSLPIILSEEPLGDEFISITANNLNAYNMAGVNSTLKKLYASPLYKEYRARKKHKKKHKQVTVYKSFCKENLDVGIMDEQDEMDYYVEEYGISYTQYRILALIQKSCLMCLECCHIDWETYSVINRTIFNRLEDEYCNLAITDSNEIFVEAESNSLEITDTKSELSALMKVYNKINALILANDPKILPEPPKTKDEVKKAVAFYCEREGRKFLSFSSTFFDSIISELGLSYTQKQFEEDCNRFGLRAVDTEKQTGNKRNINIKQVRCLSLHTTDDDPALLKIPDELNFETRGVVDMYDESNTVNSALPFSPNELNSEMTFACWQTNTGY